MSFNKKGNLGPRVGKIAGKSIYAPQLLKRGFDWDGNDTNGNGQPIRHLTENSDQLLIFWSRSGSTKLLASKIVDRIHPDIYQIQLENPYPAEYFETLDRANWERENVRPPKIIEDGLNLDQYKTIFVGFQTWAMTLSQPWQSFLRAYGNQFTNKMIMPFETEGGYGEGNSLYVMKDLINLQGGKDNTFGNNLIIDGNKVNSKNTEIKIDNWLSNIDKFK